MKTKLLFLSAAFVFLTACQSATDEKAEDTSSEKEEATEETTKENDTGKDEENNSTQTDTLDKGATEGEVTTEHYSNVVDGIEVDIELTADKENNTLLTVHQVEKIPYEYYDLKNEEEADQLVKEETEFQEEKLRNFPDDIARFTIENRPEEKVLLIDKFYDYSDPKYVQQYVTDGIIEGEGTEETVDYELYIESLKELGVIEDDSASNSNLDKETLREKVLLVADEKEVEKYDKYYYEAKKDIETFYKMYVVDTKKDKILYEVQASEVAYSDLNIKNAEDVEELIEVRTKEFEKQLNDIPDDIAKFEIINDEEDEMIKVYHVINYESPENVKILTDANIVTEDPSGKAVDFVSFSKTVDTLGESGGLKEFK